MVLQTKQAIVAALRAGLARADFRARVERRPGGWGDVIVYGRGTRVTPELVARLRAEGFSVRTAGGRLAYAVYDGRGEDLDAAMEAVAAAIEKGSDNGQAAKDQ